MRTLVILAVLATAVSLACGSDDAGAGGGGGSGGSGGCANTGEGGTHPVDAGVRVSWTLEKDGSAATCAAFERQQGVQMIATEGDLAVASQSFPCSDGQGLVRGLEPGDYVVSVALVDAGGLALAAADPQSVSLDLACLDPVLYGCTSSGTCVEPVSVVLR